MDLLRKNSRKDYATEIQNNKLQRPGDKTEGLRKQQDNRYILGG